jgi:outer membrane protein W
MKKYFKFILLLLFFNSLFVSVFAQKFSVGVQTGINSSNYLADIQDSKELIGINIAGVFTYNPTQKIGFSLESGYLKEGNSWQNQEYKDFTQLNYFRNAILLNYTFFKDKVKIRPILQAGFYYSFLVDMRSDRSYRDNFFNDTDKGGILKAGAKMKLNDKFALIPTILFQKGFDAIVNPLPNECFISRYQNRTWSANISLVYGLSKVKN